VQLDETNAAAQLNLGVVLCSIGKFDEGVARLERAVALDPGDARIYGNVGEAYAAQRRFGQALQYFLKALDSRPDDLFLLNRAGWLLATTDDAQVRNGPRAVQLAEHAVRITSGQDVESLDTLAAAYAESGRFSDALSTVSEAIRVAQLKRRGDILPELETRLRLYQSGKTFRQ
jgi:tetratricopeptide (TPR) repeat protein